MGKFKNFGRLFSGAIRAISFHTSFSKENEFGIDDVLYSIIDTLYSDLKLEYRESKRHRLRGFQTGASNLMTYQEIESIVLRAVEEGHLTLTWVDKFLATVRLTGDSTSKPISLNWKDELRKKASEKTHVPTVRRTDSLIPYELILDDASAVKAINVRDDEDLPEAVALLKIPQKKPTVLVTGGADYMDQHDYKRLKLLFDRGLAPLCQTHDLTVVDGATDSGVIRLIGQARENTQATFSLVGVACENTIIFPEDPIRRDKAGLEPNHTHDIFVPGSDWKHASIWMNWVAETIADGLPVVTVLANGGQVTWVDLWNSICRGQPVIVIEGSGRTADDILNSLGAASPDSTARKLVFPIKLDDVEGFQAAVKGFLHLM